MTAPCDPSRGDMRARPFAHRGRWSVETQKVKPEGATAGVVG